MYHVDGEHLLVGTGSLTSNHPRPTQVPYTNTVFLAWRSMEGGRREGGGGYKRGGEGGAEEGEWEEGVEEGGQDHQEREEEEGVGGWEPWREMRWWCHQRGYILVNVGQSFLP